MNQPDRKLFLCLSQLATFINGWVIQSIILHCFKAHIAKDNYIYSAFFCWVQHSWCSKTGSVLKLLHAAAQRFSARAWCVSAVTCYNGHQNKHCSHMWSEKGLRHHQDHVCMFSAILKSLWIWSGVWTDRSGFLFHMCLRSSLRAQVAASFWQVRTTTSQE